MPTIPDISLAVIAAAIVAAVIALVPTLIQVRRTAARAEELLATMAGALPGLLADTQALVHKLDGVADTLQDLAISANRLDRFATAATRTVEGVRDLALQVARDMLLPSVSNAAGVIAVLREGMQWIRPRWNHRRAH
jgi:uncharacterized protein YoxC